METDVQDARDARKKVENYNQNHKEGPVAKGIEKQTAKLPSDAFLWASFGSMAASITLKLMKQHKTALFVGQWAPSLLIMGMYNKLVKQEGHD